MWWSHEAQVQEAVPLAQALVDTQEVQVKTKYCNWCNLALGEQEAYCEDGRRVYFHLSCHVIYTENKGKHVLHLLKDDDELFI